MSSNNAVVEKMIEVRLKADDDFLKVRETLTRIGIASRKEKKLFQSCHILHKQGKYYIVHFKELFALDGKPTNFSADDVARRNAIINLLYEWDLVEVVLESVFFDDNAYPKAPISQIKILPFKEKSEWELVAKYNIGRKK
jgi:Bacteriophage translational regulator